VTGFGEGARQKILIHQVFNRSVKVLAGARSSSTPMFLAPCSLPHGRPGNELFENFTFKFFVKDGEINS
jgi:hypothetical protein